MLWQSTNPARLRALLPEGAGWTAPCSCSSRCYYTPGVRSPGLPFPAPTERGGLVRSSHTRKEWAREIILKKATPQSRKRLWHLGITGHFWLASQVLCTQPGQMGRSPHNLDFLRGDAGVGHPAQKEADSSHSIPGLACRNGHSSLSSSS